MLVQGDAGVLSRHTSQGLTLQAAAVCFWKASVSVLMDEMSQGIPQGMEALQECPLLSDTAGCLERGAAGTGERKQPRKSP